MTEYIDRKEAIRVLSKPITMSMCVQIGECKFKRQQRETDLELIKSLSATDIQPVEYGEWTAEGNDEYGNYWDECTVCRKAVFFPQSVKNDYKYCPHCGARMDGE